MTDDEKKQNMSDHQEFRVSILNLEAAVYGDKTKGEVGMKQKVDEIHEYLVQAKGLGKFLKWGFGIVITLGAAVAAIAEISKLFRK